MDSRGPANQRVAPMSKDDEKPLSVGETEGSELQTPPGTPGRGSPRKPTVTSQFGGGRDRIRQVKEQFEEEDSSMTPHNASHPSQLNLNTIEVQNQDEYFEDDVMCVAIRVDYLKDLETDYKPRDLKAFIEAHLDQDHLYHDEVVNLIKAGAELNKFLDLSKSAVQIMVKMLDIPFDDFSQIRPSRTARKFTLAFRDGSHFKKNMKHYDTPPDSIDYKENPSLSHLEDTVQKIRKFKSLAPAQFEVIDSNANLPQSGVMPATSRSFKCMKNQNTRMYMCVGVMCLFTLGFFLLGGLLVTKKNLDYFGSGLWLARASAFAILILVMFCIFFISRDMLTALRCRGCCGSHCSIILNEHVEYHKFCGILIAFFSVLHTIGHLYGTYPAMANASNLAEMNDHMTKQFKEIHSYAYLLFATLPGISGLIILIAILLILFMSLPCVRHKKWEVFSYSHLLYFVFLIGLMFHGFEGWFNNSIPPTFFLVGFCFFMVCFQLIRRRCQKNICSTMIERVLITQDKSYIYLKLFKPAGTVIQPGQYMFLNLPNFSKTQWHPFSIASGCFDDTINFIIKDSGDFTHHLISQFNFNIQQQEKQGANVFRGQLLSDSIKQEDLDIKSSSRRLEIKKMPRLFINGPFGAPCQSAVFKRSCVFVGAGVGLTPFLAYLRSVPRTIIYMTFVFICRDPELMNWISYTIKDLRLNKNDLKKIQIMLYLTKRKEVHCLESFLFWRAFLKMQKKQKQIEERGGEQFDPLFRIPIKISYERPALQKILIETARASRELDPTNKEVSVYSCAPHSFNNRLRGICSDASKKVPEAFSFYPEVFS